MKKVLAINSGSSSFKFKLFSLSDEQVIVEGSVDRVGLSDSIFEMKISGGEKIKEIHDIPTQEEAVEKLLKALKEYKIVSNFNEISGIGHRIVAGGEVYKDSTLVDEETLQKIYDLSEYAPLHNPAEADGIKAFMKLLPDVPEVAVFDTSFHQTLSPENYLYSIPYEYYEKYKARKFGAHGTSVRYVAKRTATLMNKPLEELKLIVCHIGSGASITAVKDGKSYDTSMGFSPLAGITMSTRSGDVDPSLLQYIMKKEPASIQDYDKMIEILNNKSGLLGISNISPDMRDIKQATRAGNKRAKLARDIFISRIIKYIGSYYFELQGIDAIVFTAGVGEHDKSLRRRVMQQLEFIGLDPDFEANQENGEKFISKANSKVKALIVPTDEEVVIKRDVERLAKL